MKQIEKTALLNDLFAAYYQALYEQPDAIDVQDAAAVLTDALNKVPSIKKDFNRLVKYRQEFILSDREYAAFVLAWNDAVDAIKRIEAKERKGERARKKYRERYGDFIGDILYLEHLKQGKIA